MIGQKAVKIETIPSAIERRDGFKVADRAVERG